jgi:flavodoxin
VQRITGELRNALQVRMMRRLRDADGPTGGKQAMKALVIYDSYFGNTERIAKAMGEALAHECAAEVVPADQMTLERLQGADLVIVGSPTRSFRPTPGVTQWLKQTGGDELRGKRVAAFDTRIRLDTIGSKPLRFMVKTGGFAAKAIAKSLVSKGGTLTAPPEGFTVDGEEGPLTAGELERAGAWARQIVAVRV